MDSTTRVTMESQNRNNTRFTPGERRLIQHIRYLLKSQLEAKQRVNPKEMSADAKLFSQFIQLPDDGPSFWELAMQEASDVDLSTSPEIEAPRLPQQSVTRFISGPIIGNHNATVRPEQLQRNSNMDSHIAIMDPNTTQYFPQTLCSQKTSQSWTPAFLLPSHSSPSPLSPPEPPSCWTAHSIGDPFLGMTDAEDTEMRSRFVAERVTARERGIQMGKEKLTKIAKKLMLSDVVADQPFSAEEISKVLTRHMEGDEDEDERRDFLHYLISLGEE